MQERTANNKQSRISPELQEYINELVKEVVLNGKDFNSQKKWLKKYVEAENGDFDTLNENLEEFLEALPEYKISNSKFMKKQVELLAKTNYITEDTLLSLTNPSIIVQPTIINNLDLLIPYRKGNKWGFCDKNKNIIIPCEFSAPLGFSNYISPFSEDLTIINCNGKLGYINRQGNVVIPCEFDDAGEFSEGLARVKKHDKWGFVNKQGEIVIPFQFDQVESFAEGLGTVELDGKWGCINKKGNIVLPCQFYSYVIFSEGLASVYNEYDEYGYINKHGNVVIPYQFDNAIDFSEGLACVCNEYGKWGYINKQGEIVIPYQFDYYSRFSEGLAGVSLNSECRYIDKNGQTAIPYIFDKVTCFSEGLAYVEFKGTGGYIDKQGNVVSYCKYLMLEPCLKNLARVICSNNKGTNKWGYIDKNGTEYWED